MSKVTKKFVFDTPITSLYGRDKGRVLCYARVSGLGYYTPCNHGDTESDDDPESIFDFDIENVVLKMGDTEQDNTIAFKVGDSDMKESVIKAAQAHMQYLFANEVNEHWGHPAAYEIADTDHTDLIQNAA